MSFWNFLFGGTDSQSTNTINPANGLPMVNDTFIDVAGNTYGTDSSDWGGSSSGSDWNASSSSDSWSSSSSFDSSSSFGSSWD